MREQYRVVVWGPGDVGGTVLRTCLRRPEFAVVGARVWSAAKDGVDVGTLVGEAPIGVRATTDVDALVALDADCVVHTPLPAFDETETIDEVARLLESGKNVVSAQSFYNPRARATGVTERLERACWRGGATLLGGGLHPSFVSERLMMTLTGLCDRVDHVRVVEQVDCAALLAANPFAREYVGWGVDAARFDASRMHAQIAIRIYRDSICAIADRLYGVAPEDVRVDVVARAIAATERLACGPVTIEPGQAKTIVYEMHGSVGARRFYTGEEYWYLGAAHRVIDGFGGSPSYLVEVEGAPTNVRMHVDLTSPGCGGASPIHHVTAVPLVQAIIPVCEAEPGFMILGPAAYCTNDYRRLANPHANVACDATPATSATPAHAPNAPR